MLSMTYGDTEFFLQEPRYSERSEESYCICFWYLFIQPPLDSL